MDTAFLKSKEATCFRDILDPYLTASNHNIKYLGLVGMSYIDTDLWDLSWLDGILLCKIICSSCKDITIITQAIENLDKIMCIDVLRTISSILADTLNRNYEVQSCNTALAYWLINRVDRKSTRLNSSHSGESRMPSSA